MVIRRFKQKLLFQMLFIPSLLFMQNLLGSDSESLQTAGQSYQEGIQADTIVKKEEAFNKALRIYQSLENESQPYMGNGKIYYNLGNTYYQLSEYPIAAYFYHQAGSLMPRDSIVKENLNITLDQLGLEKVPTVGVWEIIFFFHYLLSLPERLQLFFVLSLVLIGLISIFIFLPQFRWYGILLGISICWVVFFTSITYTRYLAPLYGVIIKPDLLRMDLIEEKIRGKPLEAGSKVMVLDVTKDWVKIFTPNEQVGYIPSSSLRVLAY